MAAPFAYLRIRDTQRWLIILCETVRLLDVFEEAAANFLVSPGFSNTAHD